MSKKTRKRKARKPITKAVSASNPTKHSELETELLKLEQERRWPDLLDHVEKAADGKTNLVDNPIVTRTCGRAFLEMREWVRAYAWLSGALDCITEPDLRREIFIQRAESSLQGGVTDDVESDLREAIKIDASDWRPYLGLARLYRSDGDDASARKVLDEGLDNSQENLELRMMRQALDKRRTISACMMVKNEEELLPGALDSVRDWVDEIIVVDTGSTDRTIEIAESYGAKIYHQPWEGNFSKHRNYTIELATCDWVFIIDADERLDQRYIPMVRELVDSGEHSIISINVYNYYESTDHTTTYSGSIRFWKRELDLKYDGIVHNDLQLPKSSVICRAPIRLEHLGYDLSPDKMKAKYDRTVGLLKQQLEENAENGFAWFNLAQSYRGALDEDDRSTIDLALDAAYKAVEYNDPENPSEYPSHLMALNHVAWVSLYGKDFDTAEEYANRALAYKPDYLDMHLLMGSLHNHRNEFEKALEAYEQYLKLQSEYNEHRETTSLILYHLDSRANAFYGMGLANEGLNDLGKASEYYRKSLEVTPGYLEAALRLGNIYLQDKQFDEAVVQFQAQLKSRQPAAMAAAGIGYVNALRGNHEEAERYYQKAVEMDPTDPAVILNIAIYSEERGNREKAIQYFEKLLAVDPSNDQAKHKLFNLCFEGQDYERAAELLEMLVETSPNSAELLCDLGNCFFRMEKYEIAEEKYRRALEVPDAPPIVYRNLGITLFRRNNNDSAATILLTYHELQPEDQSVLVTLGDVHARLAEFEKALTFYEPHLRMHPQDVVGLYKISECYRLMGQQDAASLGYRRILEIEPSYSPARERLQEIAQSNRVPN